MADFAAHDFAFIARRAKEIAEGEAQALATPVEPPPARPEFVAEDVKSIAQRQREIQADIAREVGCEIKPVEQVAPKEPEDDAVKPGVTFFNTGSGGFKTPDGSDWDPYCGLISREAIDFLRKANEGFRELSNKELKTIWSGVDLA